MDSKGHGVTLRTASAHKHLGGFDPGKPVAVTFKLPLVQLQVPHEFATEGDLERWVGGVRSKFELGPSGLQMAKFLRTGVSYRMIAVLGFSGRRAVGLICYRDLAKGIFLTGTDSLGVDLSEMMDSTFNVANGHDFIVLKSGQKVLAHVKWPLEVPG